MATTALQTELQRVARAWKALKIILAGGGI